MLVGCKFLKNLETWFPVDTPQDSSDISQQVFISYHVAGNGLGSQREWRKRSQCVSSQRVVVQLQKATASHFVSCPQAFPLVVPSACLRSWKHVGELCIQSDSTAE